MKNRLKKKKKPILTDVSEDDLCNLAAKWEAILSKNFAKFIPDDLFYLDQDGFHLLKSQPKMNRSQVRIKRKNGKVETHILMSDGSIDMGELMPFVKLKKGDKVIQ